MSKFITTIHLENGNEADYSLLHSELEKELFKSEEHAAKSKAYISERESFSVEGHMTLQDVAGSVIRVISKMGKESSFFVIRDKHITNTGY